MEKTTRSTLKIVTFFGKNMRLLNYLWAAIVLFALPASVHAQKGTDMTNPIELGIFTSAQPEGFLDELKIEDFGDHYGGSSEEVFYRFTVTGTTDLTVSLGSITSNQIYVLNESGSVVTSYNYTSEWYPWNTSLSPGTYFLVIEGPGNNLPNGTLVIETSMYVLDDSGVSPPPNGYSLSNPAPIDDISVGAFQFQDTRGISPVFGYGSQYGNINDDVFYRFTISGTTGIEISLCESNFGTDVYLLNSSGGLIVSNNGNLCATNSSIETTLAAGTYYIVVEGSASGIGTYTLQVQGFMQTDEGTNMGNAILIGNYDRRGTNYTYHDARSNGPAHGHGNSMGQSSDDIYYKVVLGNTSNLSASLCGSDFDTYLYLLNSSGAILQSNNNGGPLCTGLQSSLEANNLAAGTYYLVVEGNGGSYGMANLFVNTDVQGTPAGISLLAPGVSSDENYVWTQTVLNDNVMTISAAETLSPSSVRSQVQYFDGLGRLSQEVAVNAAPDGRDLVTPYAYDGFGRVTRSYLPYAAVTTTSARPGSLRINALTTIYSSSAQYQFYQRESTSIPKMPNPFQETVFDDSPLHRIFEVAAPGHSWALAEGHTIKHNYEVNVANEIRLWRVNRTGSTNTGATASGHYSAGQLVNDVVYDENGNATLTFADKEGRTISKWVQDGGSNLAPGFMVTDYVYDEVGNLAYVIPPALATLTTFTEMDANFLNYIYAYHYDGRNRPIAKKIPGKGWEYTVFNTADMPLYVQDASQRERSGGAVWTFFKYDRLGRVIMTGEMLSAQTRAALQATVNTNMKPGGSLDWYESRASGQQYGYTATTYPVQTGSGITVFSVNYYDDYSFLSVPAVAGTAAISNFRLPDGSGSESSRASGLLTGSLVRVLGTANFLLSETMYDDRFRVSRAIEEHRLGGVDETSHTYNFVGELLAVNRQHKRGGAVQLTYGQQMQYDHAGRQVSVTEQINGQTPSITRFMYNALGQLELKEAGNQTTVHRYNPRGWISSVSAPLFSIGLSYDRPFGGHGAQYNGNISRQTWAGGDDRQGHSYAYSYDPANRLTSGISSDNFGESLTYDKMGNIQSLVRTGIPPISGAAGTFAYDYGTGGNRLQGFSNGGSYTRNFQYDGNGRVTADGHQKTSYNEINLPKTITDNADIQKVAYLYDAAGRKLSKTSPYETREYINGIEYVDSGTGAQIDFLHTQDGIARRNGTAYVYEYFLKDHLGNTRVVHDQTGTVIQQTDYYPFGLEINRKVSSPKVNYTYNGKEWQQETGHYDYGARPYDPVIARWNMVDPMADSYHAYSPYIYALNDPIGKLDPNGLWVENASGWTTNDGDKIAEFVKQLKANEEKRGDLLVNTPGTIIRKDAKGNLTRSEVAKGDAATDAVLDQAFEFAVGFTPLGFYFDARAAITGVDMSGEELSPFWRIAGIVPVVSEIRTGSKIVKGTVAAKGGVTVLGKYPDYINHAGELGAKRFSIPSNIWNKMSAAEQWDANRKFLDRMIMRGDKVILSNPVLDINKVSGAFRQELDYLIGKGYRLNSTGTQMIK